MEEKIEKKKGWWKSKKTSQKVSFCISILLVIASVLVLFILLDLRLFNLNDIADKMYGVGVYSGWEAIGIAFVSSQINWIFTIITIFLTFIFIFVSNFITHLFDHGNRKAKTISSLIRSLLKYIAIIAAICVILAIWGVNILGIMAGVGVITLIVGLGCQSLIQDVVSGMFIVFDDYFAVGETVIIDGFRGTVDEIGLKSTKLVDFGGNIKSITNSSITTVVNLSRLRSLCTVKLAVSYNEDVHRVEALILEEIEQLKIKVPNIIEGPLYKGIDSIDASAINFLVIAFCNEADRFQVTRDLNREFFLLFKKHDIIIPYNQVTVNPQDELKRKQASPEQIALALQEQNKLRGLEEVQTFKKRSVKRTFKESLDKTKDDLK